MGCREPGSPPVLAEVSCLPCELDPPPGTLKRSPTYRLVCLPCGETGAGFGLAVQPAMARGALLRAASSLVPAALRLHAGPAATLLAVRGAKTTTGIVGLPVVEDARGELRTQLQAVLEALAAIPEHAEYRRSVEKMVRFKLAAVDSDAPDEAVEAALSRQLEEEIKMCREELSLIPKMAGASVSWMWVGVGGRTGERAGGRHECKRAVRLALKADAFAAPCLAPPLAPARICNGPPRPPLPSSPPPRWRRVEALGGARRLHRGIPGRGEGRCQLMWRFVVVAATVQQRLRLRQ